MHDLIALTQWPTMPAPMSSSNPGEAWIWGDFVLTLQTQPKKVSDAMHQIAGARQTAPSAIDYPFAVTVYYRKDKNPHGPSNRPIFVVGLERMNNAAAAAMLRSQGINPDELGMTGDSPPVLGMFTASSRSNLGGYDGPIDVDSVRDQLFAIIGDRLQADGKPVKIGPISAIHGHPNTGWPALAPKTDDPDMKGIRGFFYKGGAILMLVGGLWTLWNDYSFEWASSSTRGVLTSIPTSHAVGGRKARHTEYYVDYVFQADGQRYTGRDSIRRQPSAKYVTVYYERANPANSKVELPNTWGGWGASIMGFFGALVFFQPWKWLRSRNA